MRRHLFPIGRIMEPQEFTMKRKALALLSGGLDSTLAVRLMLDMGVDVEALNFTSPFCTCTGKNAGCKSEAVRVAEEFHIPIKVMNKGLDYLEVVRNPRHGYGKGLNPCIDCRIYLLQRAKEYMVESGADFVITGEVLGQRPMSQRRDAMRVIERESGLEDLLVRPLSAQFFAPTLPEREGWIDREKLLAIRGRSRKDQIERAFEMDVRNYPCPAGGCLLTELSFVPKVRDMLDHSDELNLRDCRLLKIGRHFRIGERTKVIIGRNEADNAMLENVLQPGETAITWMDGNTPAGIMIGAQDPAGIGLAARILLRYTKAEPAVPCRIKVRCNGREEIISVANDMNEAAVTTYLIA
jgi:tRNA-uridine 2-sulfurtransferase